MDIYIIIGKLEGFYGSVKDKFTHESCTEEREAIERAIDFASGDMSGSRKCTLSSIVKLDDSTLKAEKLVLQISDGKFKLRPVIAEPRAQEPVPVPVQAVPEQEMW